MASTNHVNYWKYLEEVTANRNREAENVRHNIATEGLDLKRTDSQVSLNKTQELLNLAGVGKTIADTTVAHEQAKKISADTLVSKVQVEKIKQDIAESKAGVILARDRLNKDIRELEFSMDKFVKEYILDEKDAETRRLNIYLGAYKLIQDFDIHLDVMAQRKLDRIIHTLEISSNTAVNIVKAVLGVIPFSSSGSGGK